MPAPEGYAGIRSYKRRAGRVTTTQRDALDRLWPRYGLAVDGRRLDLPGLFGRSAPVVLDIGCGMGHATAAMAEAEPERDVIAVDVHTPGLGNLLKLVEAGGLTNVRIADGDARVLLDDMLGPTTLVCVRIFFPDPWPKARHIKRRLLDDQFAALLADRLVDGGLMHVVTDEPEYAEQVRAVVGRSALLGPAAAPWRPTTKFELRAVEAGRPAYDIAAVRLPRPASG